MAERFDGLFSWLDEAEAVRLLQTPGEQLPNPGIQYVAATRLGAATSEGSLVALLGAATGPAGSLNERLTRRKALEALGRRPDPRSLAALLAGLACDDPAAVVNAANSLGRLLDQETASADARYGSCLQAALAGPATQQRAVLQCLTRLGLADGVGPARRCLDHADALLDGAARAYLVQLGDDPQLLLPVLQRLHDPEPGQRRTAVIDLGLAGLPEHLEAVVRTPVSMPLRALAAFPLARRGLQRGMAAADMATALDALCRDDPRGLQLVGKPQPVSDDSRGWIQLLLQRDENRQYAAEAGILSQPRAAGLATIDHLQRHHASDYGGHYMLMRLVGLGRFAERREWLEQGLRQEAPQYRKSRTGAAVALGELGSEASRPLLQQQRAAAKDEQLIWACEFALALLDGDQEASRTRRAEALLPS